MAFGTGCDARISNLFGQSTASFYGSTGPETIYGPVLGQMSREATAQQSCTPHCGSADQPTSLQVGHGPGRVRTPQGSLLHFNCLYILSTDNFLFKIEQGRNNMLHTVILFFWLFKTKFEGRIDRISLDKAGLNLLWIFN